MALPAGHVLADRTNPSKFRVRFGGKRKRRLSGLWQIGAMLLLLALAEIAPSSPAVPVRVQATAAIRIERAGVATKTEWERLPPQRRRELIRTDELGRSIAIRLIEHE
jgi:hypothetical protein